MYIEQIAQYKGNEVIRQIADQQKLLGVIIEKNLSWDNQIDAVCPYYTSEVLVSEVIVYFVHFTDLWITGT